MRECGGRGVKKGGVGGERRRRRGGRERRAQPLKAERGPGVALGTAGLDRRGARGQCRSEPYLEVGVQGTGAQGRRTRATCFSVSGSTQHFASLKPKLTMRYPAQVVCGPL